MTQHQKILIALREAGDIGINSFKARVDLRIIQLPTRIWELKRMNYDIAERSNPDKSVNYILVREPEKPKPKKYVFVGSTAIEI